MIIRPFQDDIFEHIENNKCDAFIVWGRKGFTSIYATWGQFAERHKEDIDFYDMAISPWQKNHSKPVPVNLNGQQKYFYFIRNDNDDDTVSDSRFVLQLISAFYQLLNLGISRIAMNGSVSPGIRSVREFNNDAEMQNEIKTQNDILNTDRVNLIIDFLFSLHVQRQPNLTVDLVSMTDVFVKNIPREIFYQ